MYQNSKQIFSRGKETIDSWTGLTLRDFWTTSDNSKGFDYLSFLNDLTQKSLQEEYSRCKKE